MRIGAVVVISLVALFGIVANTGMAVTPNEEWNQSQVLSYVQAQTSLSDISGHPQAGNVARVETLPQWAPAGQLAVVGDCNGLYVSNGEDYSTIPDEVFQRATWMTVELGHVFQHTFRVTVHRQPSGLTTTVPLVRAGPNTVSMTTSAVGQTGRSQSDSVWPARVNTCSGPRCSYARGGRNQSWSSLTRSSTWPPWPYRRDPFW